MATILSTKSDFYRDLSKFHAAIGDKSHTQEQITGGHKCLTLRYLGLQGSTEEEIETCAMFLKIATTGAIARGWNL